MMCGTWIVTGCEREITCEACCCCDQHCQCKKTRVVNRRKGPFDVYIGRPGPWGNPFSHMEGTLAEFKVASRAEAVSKFREWFLGQPALVERARRELRGKVLGCWCKPASCHGDVIAEIIDQEMGQ
jgi:hypothetical protein